MLRKLAAATALVATLAFPSVASATLATPLTPIEGATTADNKVTISWTPGACEGTSSCSSTVNVLVSKTAKLDAAGRLVDDPRYAANQENSASAITSTLAPGEYWYQLQWSAYNAGPGYETLRLQSAPVHFTVVDNLTFVKTTTGNFYRTLKKWDYNVQIAGTSGQYRVTTQFAIQAKNRFGKLVWVPSGRQSKVIEHSLGFDAAAREREYFTWAYGRRFGTCKAYNVRFTTTVVAVGSPGAVPKRNTTIGKLVCRVL